MKIADAPSYDPSAPLPTGKEARDHIISKGQCQPKNISLPDDKRKRKFLVSWYDKLEWLEYSAAKDKAFCFYCRIFMARNHGRDYWACSEI